MYCICPPSRIDPASTRKLQIHPNDSSCDLWTCTACEQPLTLGVKIQRIRWLSKASDKTYGSVVVFLADHQEAEALLAKGMMDFGGEMAYTRTYERRQGPTRCFKCHGYGHVEARCNATAAVCGKCAQTGHTATDRTSTRIRCATCQGPHQAIDRTCPKYLEMLRRFNPVERYG